MPKKKTILPKVPVYSLDFNNHGFVADDKRYEVKDLIELSKNYTSFEIPLAAINIGRDPWQDLNSIDDFLFHYKRVEDADLKYPIILDNLGRIADGYHRICKAILQGKKTIKAIRLEEMPERYTTIKENE